MAALQRFFAILLADLRERTRSPRFWVLLGLMIVATWKCFPPLEAHYMVVSVGDHERGFYSSAWIGMVLAMAYSPLLSLFGFYLVRGTLVRDIETRVWQLLVATPMTRGGYLLAKWASHMAVFGLIVAAGLGVALVAQQIRGEDRAIHLLELIKPVLLFNLPGLAITSMFAIWFDLLPWLRKTTGNVLFFIIWIALISASVGQLDNPSNSMRTGWLSDPNGLAMAARDFHRVREEQTGKPRDYGFMVGHGGLKTVATRFEWKSWSVRPMDVLGRALWLFGALVGVVLAAPLLDWAASRGTAASKARTQAGLRLRWLDRMLDPFARGPLTILAVAELKQSFRQRRLWWWLAVLVAFGLQIFGSGMGFFIGMLLAWMLPLDTLARGILREKDHGTGGLVFASPHILRRLLTARFAVGMALLLTLTLPGLMRLIATFPLAALAALVICISVVSWGLCLGAICRNSRPFELVMLTAAYIALNGVALFDMSASPQITLLWHGLLLLPAWLALAWAWPRLARV